MSSSNLEKVLDSACKEIYEEVKSTHGYKDYKHNHAMNAMGRNLHDEFHSKGVQVRREPDIAGGKPDFLVDGKGVVEVKAKSSGVSQQDRSQMQGYKDSTGLDSYRVNFGKQDGPHIRKF